ncbi:hypothetical protein DICPUDRAFT_158827 [Dictyostelium purpureum]|uniref:RabGAP/TBC domain-containing protein n=1 Tax=Dictyostelium purpureum TaxID=5786 RepID=F1A2L1_DICPU|nr:uncharacterized protein DICPUDRAFT_158827 [Dictyostelium purpureum]EGC29571.1 hypothetical protein DICPUDRAFT_158827 [Dictyostelium purpureum]|eukprot:XP_003293903.1 hypothetical protein DICPUDRAFT_158827 [Dictyostelium purpureum]
MDIKDNNNNNNNINNNEENNNNNNNIKNDDDDDKLPKVSISTFIKSNKKSMGSSPPQSNGYLSIGHRRLKGSTELENSTPSSRETSPQLASTSLPNNTASPFSLFSENKKGSVIQHIVDVKWRDKYGFICDNFIPELKKFEALEEETGQEKMNKWVSFHEQYKNVGLSSNPKQLRKLLSNGIPHASRASLWKVYSGSFEKQRKEELLLFKQQKEEKKYRFGTIRGLTPPTNRKSYYLHLQHIIKTHNRMSTRFQSLPEIEKDISRTFPGHPFFDSDEGKRKLSRVLEAYSLRNRKVGYCQSMNIVAGFLLFAVNKNEEDAFWLLATIVEDYCQNYYSTNLMGSQADMNVFSILVSKHLPKLYQHLDDYDVSLSLISTKWFMCLFVNVLPTEIVFRIWDHIFVECGIYGYHKPPTEEQWLQEDRDKTFRCLGFASYNLLMTGLSILAYYEETLLNTYSTPHLIMILSTHIKGLFNAKAFFKKYREFRSIIDEEEFIELKKKCEVNFLKELEDMRKARDLYQTMKFTRFSKTDLEKIWLGFRQLEISSRYSMGKSMILDYKMFQNVFQFILPNSIGSGTADESNTREVIIKQLFKAFDKNRDGTLDFTELMSGLCILAKGTSEERLKLYFTFFDSNNTGYVSKPDMKLMLENVYDKIDSDPLAVSQYSIDDYVEMIFANFSIPEGEGLTFEMFRQAIANHPRIFRCFMLEEETFSIEDFEDIYNDVKEKELNDNGINSLSSLQKRKGTKSRIKFQEVLAREELENSNNANKIEDNIESDNNNTINNNNNNDNTSIPPENNSNNLETNNSTVELKKEENNNEHQTSSETSTTINKSSDDSIKINNGSEGTVEKSDSEDTNTHSNNTNKMVSIGKVKEFRKSPSEQPKASTFNSSTLISAIEKAKVDKPQPPILDEMKKTPLNPQQTQQAQQQQGNPLSCCKFM